MKKHIINRSFRGTAALSLALLAALAALNTTEAAYWNRSRNHRGSSDDSGGGSSSSSSQSNSNSRGRDPDRDGIPNITDPDIDNDGIPNGQDPNVDGGIATSGPCAGKYIGDRLPNDHPAEKDIDDDGLSDDSSAELDIDGDGKADDSPDELDIDGDGKADDSLDELDIDGDGRADDSPDELDIDGDGHSDGSAGESDTDGDGVSDSGVSDSEDSDDDSDSTDDSLDDDDDGDGHHDGMDDGNPGNPPAAGPVGDGTAPAALTGLVYVVRENNGEIEARLNFSGATAGAETDPDGDNDGFTYTYTPGATTASLRLQFKADKWDEYDLNYATGRNARREFDKNALKDTDTGSFNLDGVTPPPPPPSGGGTGTQVGDGTAPATISGIKWTVSELNGHPEANLLFTTATAGSENDPDGDVDPFTYVYGANGASATLRLNFKPGKWDEYDLNFATGIYVRREFKNNALNDTDTGRFAVAAP